MKISDENRKFVMVVEVIKVDKGELHIILGADEYSRVKMESVLEIGEPGQPVAELTKFGWVVMSSGKEPLE